MIFITHKIKEALEITDRITILRKGRVQGTLITEKTTPKELVRLMIGGEEVKPLPRREVTRKHPVLIVKDLRVRNDLGLLAVRDLSFKVYSGEIFGIAGVEGNGQTELIEALTGLRDIESGSILLNGEEISKKNPKELYKMGLGHIPEDKETGLIYEFSVAENSILGKQRDREFLNKYQLLDWKKIFKHAAGLIKRFKIVAPSVSSPARSMSGGNIQKFIVGRELSKQPELIIAAQPTKGLDVIATYTIRNLLIKARNENKAVLLVSADLDEVMELSDRIAVMYEGKFMGIKRREELSREEIGLMMSGVIPT
ncbi:hypothetical protein DRN86_04100 [Candidatus Geothermarchaeota archaeon]|nr:MAG: hypothetical protein DRN86_04100 [Candidatus Geothermarchaeota archaeon]